jgi:hypothetical protein
MSDPIEAVRKAQNLVRRAREDGIKAHIRAQQMREDASRKSVQSGCDDYMSKPLSITNFLDTVKRFLS